MAWIQHQERKERPVCTMVNTDITVPQQDTLYLHRKLFTIFLQNYASELIKLDLFLLLEDPWNPDLFSSMTLPSQNPDKTYT